MLSSLVQALRPVNYSHARHHPQIQFICRDVYGGHDYLPAQLLKYSMDSEKAVVMLEDPQQQEGNLLGVVCIERRLDTAFVFGLRVHPDYHGRGIGARLTAAAEERARELPGVRTLQTATIMPNAAMRAILVKQGWQVQQALDMWPKSEETVRIAMQQPGTISNGSSGGSIISFVDGAAAAVSTPEALAMVPRWQVCCSLPQLRTAVREVLAQLEGLQSLPKAQAARCWLPFHYAPLPVDCQEAAAAVEAGNVFILPGSAAASGSAAGQHSASGLLAATSSSVVINGTALHTANGSHISADSTAGAEQAARCQGVLILQHNGEASASEYTHRIAGIIGGSPAAVESALLVAAKREPHFAAFIARPAEAAPVLFETTPTGQQHVLVYSKDL